MNSQQAVFINGRAQIIEMLQYMEDEDRNTLLKNIRIRNPILANELLEKSLVFENIGKLSDHEIRLVLNYVQPTIMGVALKSVNQDLQRRVLGLAQRGFAEKAYEIMIKSIGNEMTHIKKAQNKILETMVALNKKKQINLK
ncbi:MAG: hypothetical protein A2381_14160 [Bdellovibrionales bacterium RIFOXYB1_FULL_37_110]|nr:MAG: hypothetical protein A2181_05395 [Bdellovibrionales bacterium RIFOXYA1_FULL_38_20]OFZ47807.1 MAG: hypothetical protein A2417_15155 [Bdellovibrionales bacterium RIFOXYC1_FULL_37_79]OFZ57554.1 MAG: hypothetical protein A2381_14160 [Bdellovibrionales bacterium RIFOXYB1_FULL_37_110]OFZ61622.1 MAG: hypothetical protein A2577_10560 [Bdellovibrionales bacterium RIFOXYD1_FULL_36_51]